MHDDRKPSVPDGPRLGRSGLSPATSFDDRQPAGGLDERARRSGGRPTDRIPPALAQAFPEQPDDRPTDRIAPTGPAPVADQPAGRPAEQLGDRPTEQIPPVVPQDPGTADPTVKRVSLARSSGMMAVANLTSRITGFVRQVMLVAVLSFGMVNDSYTVANTLPNIVYELLLGGVLTSVMIPLLVRAQKEDPDGGVGYTRKLLTLTATALLVATALSIALAGQLVALYLGSQTTVTANPELARAFAVLLLPQIFFYGMGALFGAILNSKNRFGAFAWAPVLNNLVVLAVLAVYVLVPGEISLDPIEMGNAKLLVLGIGTTAGIAAQALVLLPAMRGIGVSFRPLWGWDPRLSQARGLVGWVVGYVLVGAIGYIVTTQVASRAAAGSVAIYANAWLLLQVPYGVLGVSLLTALMPRMSRAAADGRTADVIADLSLGSRLSTVFLVPISVVLTVFGTSVGIALFSFGAGGHGGGSAKLGMALAVSAFGLLPYAITLLQLRVFYAMTDSRTPTLIQVVIVAVKIPLTLACPLVFAPENVVLGLTAANSASFIVGAVLGQVLLARRLGRVRTRAVASTIWRTLVASAAGVAAAYAVVRGIEAVGLPMGQRLWAWLELVLVVLVAGPITLALMRVLKLRELDPLWRRLRRA